MEVSYGSVEHREGWVGDLCKAASTKKRMCNVVLQILKQYKDKEEFKWSVEPQSFSTTKGVNYTTLTGLFLLSVCFPIPAAACFHGHTSIRTGLVSVQRD